MKRISLAAFVGIIALATLATGCLDREPGPVCPVPTEIATTRQTANDFDGVDILVVVDNSSSMLEEQAILSTGFFTLINSLALPLENDPDWAYPPVDNIRVAIVTSDMGLQWGGGQTGGNSVPVSQCDEIGDNGAFQAADPAVTTITVANDSIKCELNDANQSPQCPAGFQCNVDPTTQIGTCSAAGAGTVNCEMFQGDWAETDSNSPNPSLTTQVACLANQGAMGCGIEQQLEAGVTGLTNNTDFMVKTHLLAVLVVSDEEDCSIKSNALFNTDEWLSGTQADGLLNVACNYPEANEQFLYPTDETTVTADTPSYFSRFVHLKGDQVTAVIFAAIVGVPYENQDTACQGNGEELKNNNCLAHDAMQINIETFTFNDGSTYKHFHPACTRSEGGEEVTSARPGRRYVEVAQEFGSNGYVYSICNKDWGPAMESIAEIIARQITATCYPKQLDWTLDKGSSELGRAKCDVVVEIIRVGDSLNDESCPAELYAGLTPQEQAQYNKLRQVQVDKKGGVVSKKIILCPLPKLSTPRDCGKAQAHVSATYPDDVVGWYYCEKEGETFDDACKDEVDNDADGQFDCADPGCQDCTVCDGTGVDCEEGCRYGVEITTKAKQLTTGHFLSVQCLQRFSFEDQNCQEDTFEICNDQFDNDGNGIWNCNDTLSNPDDRNPHLPDPNCCWPLVENEPGICNPTQGQISDIRAVCPKDDDGGEWSYQMVGACRARAKELGCNFPGAGNPNTGQDTGQDTNP